RGGAAVGVTVAAMVAATALAGWLTAVLAGRLHSRGRPDFAPRRRWFFTVPLLFTHDPRTPC
ncbi:MAG TPA: hypothetical protein VK586_18035, partial [Streptosporangiaceae bacterium]|nr:hypothetical protein [Streptosporangiaceae bacterium]